MKTKILIIISFLCIYLGITGCEENGKVSYEEKLQGIEWKLTTFVDKNGVVRKPEPNDKDEFRCYTIIFYSGGTFNGHSSTNDITGTYNVDFKNSTFSI